MDPITILRPVFEALESCTLRDGERVDAAVIRGPDPAWAERLDELLQHKSPLWKWQNGALAREEVGLDAHFYVLHRGGRPFAHVLTTEVARAGFLSHVFTLPDERRRGAMDALLDIVLDHVDQRGGRALFLHTEFDGPPFRLYLAKGFAGIETGSGAMARYADDERRFEAEYFARGPTAVEPLDWPHWPASAALFVGRSPWAMRSSGLRLLGRMISEGPCLRLLREELDRRHDGSPARAAALVRVESGALVGLAHWTWHPVWPRTCVVDVYAHEQFESGTADLLQALQLPDTERYVAYCDRGWSQKEEALRGAGFALRERLNGRMPVGVWERAGR